VATAPTSINGQVTLVPEVTPVRVLVPNFDVGTLWRSGDEAAFAAAGGDTSWLSGNTGVGYEASPGDPINYVPYLGLDLGPGLNNQSALCRIRFNIDSPSLISGLTLRMRVDDGFAAWINGSPVGSLRAPEVLTWNSGATGNANDANAVVFQDFIAPTPLTYLKPGENILAIQALNRLTTSTDFLMQPMLVAQTSLTFQTGLVFWRVSVVQQ
jgi:hypothetical protein